MSSYQKNDHFMNLKDLCILLKSKESKIRKMIFERKIPYTKIGRSIRFRKSDIEKWINLNSIPPIKIQTHSMKSK